MAIYQPQLRFDKKFISRWEMARNCAMIGFGLRGLMVVISRRRYPWYDYKRFLEYSIWGSVFGYCIYPTIEKLENARRNYNYALLYQRELREAEYQELMAEQKSNQ